MKRKYNSDGQQFYQYQQNVDASYQVSVHLAKRF